MKMLTYRSSQTFGKTGVITSLVFLHLLNGGTRVKRRLKDLLFVIVARVLLTVILKKDLLSRLAAHLKARIDAGFTSCLIIPPWLTLPN